MRKERAIGLFWAVVGLGILCSSAAVAQEAGKTPSAPTATTATPPKAAAAPDFSTPAATARTFVNALLTNDYKTVLLCVKDAQSDELSIADVADTAGRPFRFAIESAQLEPMGDAAASLQLKIAFTQKAVGGETYTLADTLKLEKIAPQQWKIIALTAAEFEQLPEEERYTRILSVSAATTRYPEILRQIRAEESAYSSVGNVKLLCLAVLSYAQQNKNTFAGLTTANYVDKLLAIHKDKSLYTCLQDKTGTISFRFNGNLSGKKLAALPNQSATVLFYEGETGKPLFRYAKNTKAIIGTLDGFSRLVTKEEAAKLIWTP